MSHPPDVSIVVATYDRLGSLERTLRSCLTQTNRLELRIELVVVDNHPTVGARPIWPLQAQGREREPPGAGPDRLVCHHLPAVIAA